MKMANLAQKYSDMVGKPAGAETDEFYPTLYLDDKQMEAMGIDAVRVGDDMTMVATVRVASMSDSKNGNRSMSFEVIEAALKPKVSDKDAASILFPNG